MKQQNNLHTTYCKLKEVLQSKTPSNTKLEPSHRRKLHNAEYMLRELKDVAEICEEYYDQQIFYISEAKMRKIVSNNVKNADVNLIYNGNSIKVAEVFEFPCTQPKLCVCITSVEKVLARPVVFH